VAAWLEGHGWKILAERYRSTGGEIDLLALDPDGWLVAVEVKLRRSGRTGLAGESVNSAAVRRRRAALVAYARSERIRHRGIRVDLVTVIPDDAPRRWHLTRVAGVDAW
jgi:Holliday junction resolvase-like predicted endonuclease